MGHTYAIDVETEGLNYVTDQLLGVALHVNGKSYYFVREHSTGDGMEIKSYLSDEELLMFLAPVMSQKNQIAVLHNAKFDLHFFSRYSFPLQSKLFDTLVAAQLLDENRRNGLKSLTSLVDETHSKYENLAEYRQFEKDSPLAVPLDKFADYAIKDVVVTLKLYEKFREQLPKDSFRGVSMQDVFNALWMPFVPVLQEMEARGFRIDVPKVLELQKEYTVKVDTLEQKIRKAGIKMVLEKYTTEEIPDVYWKSVKDYDYIEEDNEGKYLMQMGIRTPIVQKTARSKPRKIQFNAGSSLQITDLVFHNLELPDEFDMKLTPGGAPSVDADNLKAIKFFLGDSTPQTVIDMLEWRLTSKFLSTYLNAFAEKNVAGRMHAFFNMAASDAGVGGTTTGRLSSNSPNLQQVPSRGEIGDIARHLFIPSEGMKLVVADYSSMESVMFCHYSDDAALKTIFNDGLDMHSVTASGIYNIPYDKFVEEYKNGNPEYDMKRRLAKTVFFGSGYGVGAKKLQRLLLSQNQQNVPLEEVRQMLDNFYETYAGLESWKKQVHNYVSKHGFVTTLMGRKRRLPRAFSRDRSESSYAQRQAVSAIIQGSCGDVIYQAMTIAQPVFKSLGGSLVASVHDEIVGEVPERYAETACKMLEAAMTEPINKILRIPLQAEAGFGDSWAEAKH